MIPYSEAINHSASKKIVFARLSFRKHFFAWTLSGTAGIWYQAAQEPIDRLTEIDAEAVELGTFAALVSQDVSTVGAWFWDEPAERLYYKALSGSTAFENFVVGVLVFRMSQFPAEDPDSNIHDPRLEEPIPSVQVAVSQIFDSKMGRRGSGSMGVATTDYLFSRLDFEPDGNVEIFESIEV